MPLVVLVIAGSAIAAIFASLALAGWISGLRSLAALVPDGATMKVNTAVALLGAAASLALQGIGRARRAAIGCALVPAALGLATLAQQIAGVDLGIDQALVSDAWTAPNAFPGRPSPITALSLAATGVALALSASSRRTPSLHPIVLLLLGVSWFSLLSSAYRLHVVESIPGLSSLSVPTALALLGLALGTAALHPTAGVLRLATHPGAAGASARLLLPAGALLPIVVGWIAIRGEAAGVFGREAGLALFATVTGLGLIVLSWLNARALERVDAMRDLAARRLGQELDRTKVALQRATAYLESAPGAMLVTDERRRVTVANTQAERLFGAPRGELIGRPLDALMSEFAAECASGGSMYLRARGERALEIETQVRRLATLDGVVTILSARDVTAQRKAEAERAASERRFRAIFDSTFQFIGLLSPDGTLLEANETALAFGGITPAEVIGKPFWEARWWTISREAQDRLRDAIRDAAAGAFVRYETAIRGAGERVATIDFSLKPLRDERGEVILLIPEGRDITERRLAEERLRTSLADKEVLLREVHHRVKNNLQVIASLLRLHAERIEDSEARAAFQDSQDRVRSIALLHDKLCRSEGLASVRVGEYARDLTATLLRAHGPRAGRPVRVVVTTDDVQLPIDRALPCGLILNELVTNSLKHGLVAEVPDPEVRIEARQIGDDVEIRVSDNGVGLPADFASEGRCKIGIQLVRTLSRQLGGGVAFESEGGARCTLRFPACGASGASAGTEEAR